MKFKGNSFRPPPPGDKDSRSKPEGNENSREQAPTPPQILGQKGTGAGPHFLSFMKAGQRILVLTTAAQ